MVAAGAGWDDSIPAATDGAIRRVISLESAALFAFAALAAVVGLLVVGQALARQTAAESVDDSALRAMGMTTSQTTSVAVLRMVPVALAGAAVAVALAVAASPLVPIGVARRAAFEQGFRVDGPALLGGALTVILVVLGLTLLGARARPRHRRGRARPVRVIGQLAALGAPPDGPDRGSLRPPTRGVAAARCPRGPPSLRPWPPWRRASRRSSSSPAWAGWWTSPDESA